MRAAERLAGEARPIWDRIMELPFVVELFKGELPLEKFRAYILQDYTYLVDAIRNFSLIASRAPGVWAMKELVEIAHLEATGEFRGYEGFLERLGLSLEDAAAAEPLPVNVSYRSFLLATSATRSTAEALAAALPCFWSYREIALHHARSLEGNRNEIYRDWAAAYLCEDYVLLLEKLKNLLDALAGQADYERLSEMFLTASRYEHLYWQSVYGGGKWPL